MPPEYFFPLLGMGFAFGFGIMGMVRWYLKERMRLQAGRSAGDPERVGRLEARVAELEERLDFTERLLARGGGHQAGG